MPAVATAAEKKEEVEVLGCGGGRGMHDNVMWECQVCGKSCGDQPLLKCKGCEAFCYCCTEHQKLHAQLEHDEAQCSRMAQQLLRTEELRAFPFTYTAEVTTEV
eukprot:jgi/Chlat1/7047/Chrsp56S06670